MKIAIMGTGGVGGYFGAMLARGGHDVSFIARGAHGDAIRQHGLRIDSPLGDFRIEPARVTDDPATIGPVDIVMMTVKLWDIEAAATACLALLHSNTLILPFQNGITASETIAAITGAGHVGTGIAKVQAVIAKPGVIGHLGTFAALEFGETDNRRTERINGFLSACVESGIKAAIPADVTVASWQKFIFLVSMSGFTAAARSPIGEIFDTVEGTRAFRACADEVAAVGRARGINLAPDIAEEITAFAKTHDRSTKTSQLADLEHGSRLELPWLSATVCRLGRDMGIRTPVNDTLTALLSPFAMGAK